MKRAFLVALALLLIFLTSQINAQEIRWAIEVEDQSDDMVGQRLVYLVKEGIRQSSSMRLTTAKEPRIVLIIGTMPRFSDDPSIATMYSIIWVFDNTKQFLPSYLDRTMGYAGADVVHRSAQSIVARTDKLISDIQKGAGR